MAKKIVLLTGSELRHDFFRKFVASHNEINVLASYCESEKGNLIQIVSQEAENSLRLNHLKARKQTEIDFFQLFCDYIEDRSNPIFIEKGEINDKEHVDAIIHSNPDLIISYGCSIIKSALLTTFKERFINIHLGLSPYYRGSGTNFWPFVNKELELVGTTFMFIDAGIDTGEIIHQIRAEIQYNDNIHQIGNRLIKLSFEECIKIITHFDSLKKLAPLPFDKKDERYYRNRDFNEESLKLAYQNISENLIESYLSEKEERMINKPILKNPALFEL
jgi:phosphoribosylglycinamide formyltransferase 1